MNFNENCHILLKLTVMLFLLKYRLNAVPQWQELSPFLAIQPYLLKYILKCIRHMDQMRPGRSERDILPFHPTARYKLVKGDHKKSFTVLQ